MWVNTSTYFSTSLRVSVNAISIMAVEIYKYTMPSLAAYHKRKIFHSNERNPFEATDEWYHRIWEALDGCDYGEFGDFIFIDKFISGLDYETFRKYAEHRTTLTINEVLSIGFDDRDSYRNDSESETQIVVNGMMTHVEIKTEVSSFFIFNCTAVV